MFFWRSEKRKLFCKLYDITQLCQYMVRQGDKLMATYEEVKAAIAEVKVVVAEEKAEIRVKLDALAVEIQALKDHEATGEHTTPAQFDELLASVKEIGTGVEDISEPNVPA